VACLPYKPGTHGGVRKCCGLGNFLRLSSYAAECGYVWFKTCCLLMKLDSILHSWTSNTSICGGCPPAHTFVPVGPHLFEMHAYLFLWSWLSVGCFWFWNYEGHSIRSCYCQIVVGSLKAYMLFSFVYDDFISWLFFLSSYKASIIIFSELVHKYFVIHISICFWNHECECCLRCSFSLVNLKP